MRKHEVIMIAVLLFAPALYASTPTKLNAFTEGERLVYGRVVEAYRKNVIADAISQRNLLAKNYPRSVYLDNAYYLTGTLQYQAGHYAEAVRDFGIVADHFKHSNKRPAALFAKAVTYEKLGLRPQATRLLNTIVKDYPGSQESQRAWMQLKMASLGSTQSKR